MRPPTDVSYLDRFLENALCEPRLERALPDEIHPTTEARGQLVLDPVAPRQLRQAVAELFRKRLRFGRRPNVQISPRTRLFSHYLLVLYLAALLSVLRRSPPAACHGDRFAKISRFVHLLFMPSPRMRFIGRWLSDPLGKRRPTELQLPERLVPDRDDLFPQTGPKAVSLSVPDHAVDFLEEGKNRSLGGRLWGFN